MKIQQIEYLLKIIECGSMSKAAQQLYISQPALTRAISQLEREFGVTLLIRKARGIELTENGVDFAYYARRILTAANALENVFGKPMGNKSRLFLVTQQLDFIHDVLLETYHQNEAKSIHYNVMEVDRNSVAQYVLDRQADLGFLVRSYSDGKSLAWHTSGHRLEFHRLDRAGVFACVGPKSPFYHRSSITLDEAQSCLNVALDMESQAHQDLYLDNADPHFNIDRIIFSNSSRTCQRFLLETDGLMYVAKWAIGCMEDPRLHILSVESPGVKHENELLWCKRAEEPLNATSRQFLTHLYRRFGKEEELSALF